METRGGVFEIWFFVHVRITPSLGSPCPPISHRTSRKTLSLCSSRKFHIPHHANSLKWKRAGGSYTVRGPFLALTAHPPYSTCYLFFHPIQCTCSSIKGPLAILQAAQLSAPPRLRVYSSLLPEDETTRDQPNYGGVPHVLLDYLIATSLLLVTDLEEYLHRPCQDVGAARSAMEAFLPPALRNRGSGRGSYISTESRSPTNSSENVSSSNNTTLTDDTRSINSEVPSTPSSTISQYHPYSFSHFAAMDPNVPPVPEVPPEHQASVPSIPPRSSTFPSLSTLGRTPTVRRRLPQPPGSVTPITPARTEQPWSLPSARSTPDLTLHADSPDSSMSTPPPLPTPPQHPQHQRQSSEPPRSSISINRRHLPPQRQPPQLPIPIPPKLREDLARSISPSATSSDGITSEVSVQADEPGSSIREGGGGAGGIGSNQPQEFHRRFSDMDNPSTMRASVYELPPPAYDAIDFSLPRQPVLGGEGYQSFSVNSRLPPEQIS